MSNTEMPTGATRPPLPQRHRPPTIGDEQADALSDEFPEFTVWVDFRPMQDGDLHWHARQQDWTVQDIISARDCQSMRDELIIYRREHPEEYRSETL
jgi:hypothetical protein